MSRGGRRPRRIGRLDCAVCCPGGRWGPRRTRVTECYAVILAEDLYTALLRDNAEGVVPGAKGTVGIGSDGGQVTAPWEIHQNAVWRRGRIFLRCPGCSGRCTRLYRPVRDSRLACRRCWGLTYASRTLQNYKDSIYGRGRLARMLGTSQRDFAQLATLEKRQMRRHASRERWADRGRLLAAPA